MTPILAQASANLSGTGTGAGAATTAQLGALQPGDVVSAVVAKVINATTLQLLSAIGSFDVQSEALLSPLSLSAGAPANPAPANGSLSNGSFNNAAPSNGALANGILANGMTANGSATKDPLAGGPIGNGLMTNGQTANGKLAGTAPAGAFAVGARVELAVAGTPAAPTFTLRLPAADGGASRFSVAASLVQAHPAIGSGVQGPVASATASLATEPLVQAAAAILRNAVAKQGGLAQLYADLGAAVTQPNVTLPKAVVAAIGQLLDARLPAAPDGAVDAGDIKTAMAHAGLLNNALMANGQSATRAADMGLLLSQLRQALKNWADGEPEAQAGLKSSQPASAALAAARQSDGPMPPYRDGPTVPQALARPSLPDGASPRDMALHLLDKTDAAVARQTLLQIASLPDYADPAAPRAGADATRLMFDVPLATPQGTAVAQLRIERDGKNGGESGAVPVWRASFSVDIEPVGPVHVRIALVNGKATVALNAERPDSAASLQAGLPVLEAGLRNADVEPGTLSCRAAVPAAQPGPPGMFVDRPT